VKKTASATSFVAEEYAWSAARGIAAVYINSKIKASKNNVALPVYAFDAVSG
jgi:hypothetical protein